MLKNVWKGLRLEQAVARPIRREHMYGEVAGAHLTLSGALVLEVDMPRQKIPLKEWEDMKGPQPLLKGGRQIGVFYRDSLEDDSSAKTAFLLVLQEEPQFPLLEHPFQLYQSKNMIDTVMGVVVVADETHGDSLRRLGLGRWVDQGLLARCRSSIVKVT